MYLENAEILNAERIIDASSANWTYEKLIEQIREFEANLDQNHEIAIRLASFGTSILMAVEGIGYQNPDMLYFYGKIKGADAQLIQHKSQLNFLLQAVQKPDPKSPPRRIGFASSTED